MFTNVRSHVYLVARDHRVWPLAGINEGWVNAWDGGETRESTALLNARLAAWHSQASDDAGPDSTPRPSPAG